MVEPYGDAGYLPGPIGLDLWVALRRLGYDHIEGIVISMVGPRRSVGARVAGSGSCVVGLDNSGTANELTVMDRDGRFPIDRLVELPSHVTERPSAAFGAHHEHFGAVGGERSSISAIVGTGLGGGVIKAGRIVKGVAGLRVHRTRQQRQGIFSQVSRRAHLSSKPASTPSGLAGRNCERLGIWTRPPEPS